MNSQPTIYSQAILESANYKLAANYSVIRLISQVSQLFMASQRARELFIGSQQYIVSPRISPPRPLARSPTRFVNEFRALIYNNGREGQQHSRSRYCMYPSVSLEPCQGLNREKNQRYDPINHGGRYSYIDYHIDGRYYDYCTVPGKYVLLVQ